MKNIKFIFAALVLFYTILKSEQTRAQVYYCEGDSILLNALDYVSGDLQWQGSPDNAIWTDIAGATALTYMLYPVESKFYRLMITDTACMYPYYTPSQYVLFVALPSLADAGADMLNQPGTTVVLNANTPSNGTGAWSVINGSGGSFNDASNPHTSFTGATGVTYTLRWTISNPCGTHYDEVLVSFNASFTCGDTLTDIRDGQKYPTVLIGTQCWLKKDMNYGQLLNTSTAQTNNSIIEKYCYDNNTNNCDNYGALYLWDEAMQYTTTESTQGICPTGWHIPSDSEMKVLEMALGMSQAEADLTNTWRGVGVGTSLKMGGASGFNAVLGGGLWGAGGASMFINQMYYVWTSTEYDATYAWRRCLSATDDKVGRWNTFPKSYGFSVRCVKN